MKKIGIIILNWNGTADTIDCLDSLEVSMDYDIYILDNGSEKEEYNKLKKYLVDSKYQDNYKEVSVEDEYFDASMFLIRSNYNYGFACGNNIVAKKIASLYDTVLLLNNDTVIPSGTILSMYNTIKLYSCTAMTCDIRYYYDKTTLWNAGGYFTFYGDRKYYSQKKIDYLKQKAVKYIDAPFITGCALLIDSKYIVERGLFTEKFFHGEEDFNFCYNLKKQKMKVGVDLSVMLYHKVGRTIDGVSVTQKGYGKMLVHYCNRVIDFKSLYGKNRWFFWRIVYIILVFIKRLLSGMSPKKCIFLCKRIISVSNKYDGVNKELFDKLMGLNW